MIERIDRARNENQNRVGDDDIVLIGKPAVELRLLPQNVLTRIMAPVVSVIRPFDNYREDGFRFF